MHKLYCVIGRTASGKSTIVKETAKKTNMKILKSYTTREMRQGETSKNSDHIFISKEDVDKYRNDMAAYTERVGYCSFATKNQLYENDFYIINPNGYLELLEVTKDIKDIKLISIMVNVPYSENAKRAKKRGDYKSWLENYVAEDDEFHDFQKSGLIHYYLLNDGNIKDSVKKMINIIEKEREKP